MAEMLLINPRKRRTARKARRANPIAKARRVVRRKRNPIAALAKSRRRVVRRRNPIAAVRRRVMRRRNPIALGSASSYISAFKDAFIGGAGSVAIDVLMGKIGPMLPSSLIGQPGGPVGVYDAVKAVITVAAGKLLDKPTRGMSKRMASGALTVQASNIIRNMLPSGTALGWAAPANVAIGTNRVGPIQGRGRVGAYTNQAGPLLNAYTRPGVTPLLNGSASTYSRAQNREGVSTYR